MKRFAVALASALVGLMVGSSVAAGLSAQPAGEAPGVGAGQGVTDLLPPTVVPVPTPAPGAELPGNVGPVLDGVLRPLGLAPRPERAQSGPPAADTAVKDRRDFVEPLLKKNPGSPFPGLAPSAHAAYGTGTAYTTDPDLSGQGIDTEIELAFSAAAYGSAPQAARVDELQRAVAPALAAAHGFAQGSAAEIGSGEDRLVIDDNSQAQAPPTGDVVTKELTDVNLNPVANVDLLESRASARSATNGCVVGSDLASGRGTATRTDFVNEENSDRRERPILSLSDDEPPRAATQSWSRTAIVPAANGRFGLVSETRQTIAPITLFKGRPQEMTIEIGGEWILRAVADGTRGFISYGPEVDPETPILRITRVNGNDVGLTLQELQSEKGTDLGIPGVEEFIIGEDPRAIGGNADTQPTASGTLAAAAVDILRARIPDDEQPDGVLDLRVGHMEVAAAVPAGGILCPGIGMTKQSSRATVAPGERFTWTITVVNPNDCLLDNVKVVDTVTADPGVRYRTLSASPNGVIDGTTVTFEGVGPLRIGQSRTFRIDVEVEQASLPGTFSDEAVATGQCGATPLRGQAGAGTGTGPAPSVPREGRITLNGPEVTPAARVASGAVPTQVAGGYNLLRPAPAEDVRSPAALAATGGRARFLPGLVLLTAGVVFRRLRRRL
ncbi:MAG: hypothetical protein AB1679_33600 [Actinomycetota bacterium]|jgi:uncharacterized repeat protein (TIGR01451 family)